ncbi:UNVERIFIED_CONTAM: hypothetical protein FKN15_012802 [Acipenser sinensis]
MFWCRKDPSVVLFEAIQGTLFQISGLQVQALGWNLASLVVARRQLWLSQAKVPISLGHTFRLAVEEILQCCHRERDASRQVAMLLPPRAPVRGKSSRWQDPQSRTFTRMVLLPTAPLGNLRHCLQATAAAGNRAPPQSKGNAGRGNTTNAKDHLRREIKVQGSRDSLTLNPKTHQAQPDIGSFMSNVKCSKDHPKQRKTTKFASMITLDLRPFRIVEDLLLDELEPRYDLPHRTSPSFPYETQDELEPSLGIAEEDEGAISWVPSWDGDFLSLKWASAPRYPWMLACPTCSIRDLCLWWELQPSSTFPGRQQLSHAGPSLGQAVARHIQPVPASPDFLEEVRTSWEHPALAPSVLKQAAQLASLEGAEKLGMVGFPPVDSTITALVKAPPVGGLPRDPACPNPQCRVTRST